MNKQDLKINFENLPDLEHYCLDDSEFGLCVVIKTHIDMFDDYNFIYQSFVNMHKNHKHSKKDQLQYLQFFLFCLLNKLLKNNNSNETKN